MDDLEYRKMVLWAWLIGVLLAAFVGGWVWQWWLMRDTSSLGSFLRSYTRAQRWRRFFRALAWLFLA